MILFPRIEFLETLKPKNASWMTPQGTELAGRALEPVEAFPVRRQILSARHFHRHGSQEMIGGLRFRFETVLVPPRSVKNRGDRTALIRLCARHDAARTEELLRLNLKHAFHFNIVL